MIPGGGLRLAGFADAVLEHGLVDVLRAMQRLFYVALPQQCKSGSTRSTEDQELYSSIMGLLWSQSDDWMRAGLDSALPATADSTLLGKKSD